jgi:hypothetical protein
MSATQKVSDVKELMASQEEHWAYNRTLMCPVACPIPTPWILSSYIEMIT